MSNNRYARQAYTDAHYTEVDYFLYPITQLKFDGIWCGAEVSQDRHVRYFSRHGELKVHDVLPYITLDEGLYVGELMFGSEWAQHPKRKGMFYAFDLIELRGVELKKQSYVDRYNTLASILGNHSVPSNWSLVANYPSYEAHAIWERFVKTGEWEGLVFRNPDDPWDAPVIRCKPNLQIDLRVVGFEKGEVGTRLEKTLGALLAVDEGGITHTVGGGLSDKLRDAIWADKNSYLGKVFVCEYKKKFASGQLRHPNFREWHSDKK